MPPDDSETRRVLRNAWRKIGEWNGQPEEIALKLTPESDEYDACAIIVQDGTNGPVRGAASFRMEKDTGG